MFTVDAFVAAAVFGADEDDAVVAAAAAAGTAAGAGAGVDVMGTVGKNILLNNAIACRRNLNFFFFFCEFFSLIIFLFFSYMIFKFLLLFSLILALI